MIVESTFVIVADLFKNGEAQRVEDRMMAALKKAQAEGIEDPLEIRRLILEARDAG